MSSDETTRIEPTLIATDAPSIVSAPPTATEAKAESEKSETAKSESAARRIAETIATSPLVKTAFAGGDPNWGRIFAAAGRSGVSFDPARVDIQMAGIPVLRRGQPLDFNERAASNRLLAKHVPIIVNMRSGSAIARYWTCDFTAEYVRINASYRT